MQLSPQTANSFARTRHLAPMQPPHSCAERHRAACEHSSELLPAFPLAVQVHLLVPRTLSMSVSHAPDIAAVSLPTCSCTTKMLNHTLPDCLLYTSSHGQQPTKLPFLLAPRWESAWQPDGVLARLCCCFVPAMLPDVLAQSDRLTACSPVQQMSDTRRQPERRWRGHCC